MIEVESIYETIYTFQFLPFFKKPQVHAEPGGPMSTWRWTPVKHSLSGKYVIVSFCFFVKSGFFYFKIPISPRIKRMKPITSVESNQRRRQPHPGGSCFKISSSFFVPILSDGEIFSGPDGISPSFPA